tara:strand:+ start:20 stop:316 length:297 start_codon:yes stop_codon:yes gene_type:complete
MLFRIVLSLIYLLTIEIGTAGAFEHDYDSSICSQEQESERNLKCDFHCFSQGLIDNSLLTSEKNDFDGIPKLSIKLPISNTNFNLEIFPRTNSPPFYS